MNDVPVASSQGILYKRKGHEGEWELMGYPDKSEMEKDFNEAIKTGMYLDEKVAIIRTVDYSSKTYME